MTHVSRMAEACSVMEGRAMAADELGAELWPDRTGRCGHAITGGGDYAAQMLLGRMRKAGLVRTTHDPGSSRWELTTKGSGVADLVALVRREARWLDARRRTLDQARSALVEALRPCRE